MWDRPLWPWRFMIKLPSAMDSCFIYLNSKLVSHPSFFPLLHHPLSWAGPFVSSCFLLSFSSLFLLSSLVEVRSVQTRFPNLILFSVLAFNVTAGSMTLTTSQLLDIPDSAVKTAVRLQFRPFKILSDFFHCSATPIVPLQQAISLLVVMTLHVSAILRLSIHSCNARVAC